MSRTSEQLVQQLRTARERLAETRLSDRALAYCIAGLARMEEVLDRPLRVTILGEYNSGKTSVADLLIGDGLLPTSVVSNTHVPGAHHLCGCAGDLWGDGHRNPHPDRRQR